MTRLGALVCAFSLFSSVALAHPMAPASLRVRLDDASSGDAELRVPSGAALEVRLPRGCRPSGDASADPARSLLKMRFACDGSFYDGPLAVDGVEEGDRVLVFVEREDGSVFRTVFDPASVSAEIGEPPSAAAVALDYFLLGIDHLITGWDHVLFVVGLAFLVGRTRTLIFAVTAFTLGHSLTLAALALGLAKVPGAPVEIGIALTLVVLAVELTERGRAARAARSSVAMAFAFGLLHGLGFAGALAETGLPRGNLALSLFTFNVGIEVGQLAVLLALGIAAAATAPFERVAKGASAAVPLVVGALGAFAVIERVVGAWGG